MSIFAMIAWAATLYFVYSIAQMRAYANASAAFHRGSSDWAAANRTGKRAICPYKKYSWENIWWLRGHDAERDWHMVFFNEK